MSMGFAKAALELCKTIKVVEKKERNWYNGGRGGGISCTTKIRSL